MNQNNSDITVSAPGRICLFGEHQDYLHLPIIAGAISKRIFIEGNKIDGKTINISLPDINSSESFNIDDKIIYIHERDYFRSVINLLSRKGFTFSNGINCTVHGEIPINAGTSSSSALVVAWVQFCALMSDQQKELTLAEVAQYAYEAEVLEFFEPGGMMDQYSTSLGHVIYLDPFPEISVENIDPAFGAFVLGNSNEPKDTKGILARVKTGVLNMTANLEVNHSDFSLQTISYNDIEKYKNELTEDEFLLLEGTIRNRDICREARLVLETTPLDHKKVGELLTEHHNVLRDIQQISTAKIERMINAALEAGAYGAKINGSGGGGCMFAYAPEEPDAVAEAIEKAGGTSYIIKIDSGLILEKIDIAL